jgi:hypothetical protein
MMKSLHRNFLNSILEAYSSVVRSFKWYGVMKNLTPYSLLSFYHGMPQGFYYAFLSLYTSFLSVLAILYGILYATNILFSNHGYQKTFILAFSIGTITWSFLFINFWKRREKELSYALGTHMEEKQPEFRVDFKGRTEIEPISRKIVKASKSSPRFRRMLTELFFIVGVVFAVAIYYFIKYLNERDSRSELHPILGLSSGSMK